MRIHFIGSFSSLLSLLSFLKRRGNSIVGLRRYDAQNKNFLLQSFVFFSFIDVLPYFILIPSAFFSFIVDGKHEYE